jgi:hypothetical protein
LGIAGFEAQVAANPLMDRKNIKPQKSAKADGMNSISGFMTILFLSIQSPFCVPCASASLR